MRKILSSILALAFLVCAHGAKSSNYVARDSQNAAPPIGCISATSVKATHTPTDITAAAKKCADESKFDEAAELLMVASAFAYFDTQRVSDKTGHNVLRVIFNKEFGPLPDQERAKLFSSINSLDKGGARKLEVCTYLRSSEPPSYIPSYMISHGLRKFTGATEEPLIKDFNANESWYKAMVFIKCST
ncbi:hypothetical protein BTJ40_09130 [Microbulbifer sp. A4B17]|uniref:hypothetical protein n=1 Tax=Microbulbifer sp. A4B17 TaxID=359370 RepID=UPI000D52AA69|nr:hypothetical protein [Microbulbifer sp. A4B17]AWF80959.1 hypothetical protein BTJ40_09130 [Microbulbifer sp. A4B17]